MITICMKCKAFACEEARRYKLSIESDGTVRVFDDVAGHYTVAHSLSATEQRRARKHAAQAKANR